MLNGGAQPAKWKPRVGLTASRACLLPPFHMTFAHRLPPSEHPLKACSTEEEFDLSGNMNTCCIILRVRQVGWGAWSISCLTSHASRPGRSPLIVIGLSFLY